MDLFHGADFTAQRVYQIAKYRLTEHVEFDKIIAIKVFILFQYKNIKTEELLWKN